jgi:hypothetical protein
VLGAFVDGDEGLKAGDCGGHEAVADFELGADYGVGLCEVAVVWKSVGVEVVEADSCCGDDSEREAEMLVLDRVSAGWIWFSQDASRECSYDDDFGFQRHLKPVDKVDGHEEKGQLGHDIKCSNDFPSGELENCKHS